MLRVAPGAPGAESSFQLAEIIKIKTLQIELEKYRCSKVHSLAGKAKSSTHLSKARSYYKVWSLRMALVNSLQKEHRELLKQLKELQAQNKNVLILNDSAKSLTNTKSLGKTKSLSKTKALTNTETCTKTLSKRKRVAHTSKELKQVC